MADIVNDLVFAFSGNVTYSDGSNGSIECYYDSKGESYTPDAAAGINADAQLTHSTSAPADFGITTAATSWYQELTWFFITALATDTGPTATYVHGVAPSAPSPLKTVTDYVLHIRGVVSFEDGDSTPISGTWSNMSLPGGGASHVDNATNQVFVDKVWETSDAWTQLITNALNLVMPGGSIT